MKSQINFDEWLKFDLRVGEVIGINGNNIKLNCGDKCFKINMKLNADKGDKLIIGLNGNKIVIPVIDKVVLLTPEKDIENGMRIG